MRVQIVQQLFGQPGVPIETASTLFNDFRRFQSGTSGPLTQGSTAFLHALGLWRHDTGSPSSPDHDAGLGTLCASAGAIISRSAGRRGVLPRRPAGPRAVASSCGCRLVTPRRTARARRGARADCLQRRQLDRHRSAAAAHRREQNFQGSGPASGEVVDILIDPSGASDDDDLHRNQQRRRLEVHERRRDVDAEERLYAVAVDGRARRWTPSTTQVIYAGTGNNFDGGVQFIRGRGIYRSIDAGETWTMLGAAVLRRQRSSASSCRPPTSSGRDQRTVCSARSMAERNFGANAPAFDDGNPVLAGNITDLALDTRERGNRLRGRPGYRCLRVHRRRRDVPDEPVHDPGRARPAPFDWIAFAQSTRRTTRCSTRW